MTSDIRTAPKAFFHTFIALSILWCFAVVTFDRFPMLDFHTSSMFFSRASCTLAEGVSCGRFVLADLPVVQDIRSILYALPYVAAVLVVAAIGACYAKRGLRSRLPLTRLWLALASLGLGTGLLTNVILKGHSGRPRPFSSDLFGGSLPFVPAGSFHGACSGNCSFVSGEASGAGWMFCLIFLLPPRLRVWAGPPLVAASILTVFMRVAVGAHFLSDVLLGWLLSVIVFCAMMSIEEKYPVRSQ